MDDSSAVGWWQATDGFWYPPEARPDEPWHGTARGPNGQMPPGADWWLARDYRWYPPEAMPPEVCRHPGAHTAPSRSVAFPAALAARFGMGGDRRNRAVLVLAAGLVLIMTGIVTLAAVRSGSPDASTWMRLLAWSPVAAGSVLTLLGAMQYFDAVENVR